MGVEHRFGCKRAAGQGCAEVIVPPGEYRRAGAEPGLLGHLGEHLPGGLSSCNGGWQEITIETGQL